jgi:hypothetical protein
MNVEDEFSEFVENPTRARSVYRALSYACRLDHLPATMHGRDR